MVDSAKWKIVFRQRLPTPLGACRHELRAGDGDFFEVKGAVGGNLHHERQRDVVDGNAAFGFAVLAVRQSGGSVGAPLEAMAVGLAALTAQADEGAAQNGRDRW